MGPVDGRDFGGSVKFADGKTSPANGPHLNVWGFDISAAEGPIHTKDARFFCYGNSAADISKPHTFKWGTLADDVFPSANFTLPPKPRPPTCPILMYGILIYPQQNFRSRKKRASLV